MSPTTHRTLIFLKPIDKKYIYLSFALGAPQSHTYSVCPLTCQQCDSLFNCWSLYLGVFRHLHRPGRVYSGGYSTKTRRAYGNGYLTRRKNGRAHSGGYLIEENGRTLQHQVSHKKNRRDLWQQASQKDGIKSPQREALEVESATRYDSKQALRNEQSISNCLGQASCFQKATRAQSKVDPLARLVNCSDTPKPCWSGMQKKPCIKQA